jgi:hypothetical protein
MDKIRDNKGWEPKIMGIALAAGHLQSRIKI